AIVTDGTRVLGLGDIGPEAGLPVMEGKSLLFKYLGGVDAFPIPLATKDPEKIIETVKFITPSFGGVNLEDIAQPKCFGILDRLRKECDIAVWHDDQQGTATINVAGVINALKVVGKKLPDVQITLIGAGASNIRTAKLLIEAGSQPAHLILVDSKGIVGRHRKDAEAGARVIATGRSDFPNQVNNSLGFPGIFRGTLDVRARTITDEMCIAAATELALVAEEKGLDEEHIVPTMEEIDVFAREAAAVGMKAIEQGIARVRKTRNELYDNAIALIRRAREQ